MNQGKIHILAELGWNFVGDMKLASEMIHAAKESGADYAKFQTWSVDRLKPGPWDQDGRRQIYEKAELTHERHHFVKEECEKYGIRFLTSCFCERDLEFIKSLCNEVKIPSPEAANRSLVEGAVRLFDGVFLSTGGTRVDEYGPWLAESKIIPMHCISSYPLEPKNFHMTKLHFIKYVAQQNKKRFGFSGHLPDIWDAVLAVSLGATVIEKHFTIDHDLPGRDNKFAILPSQMKQLREYCDHVSQMQTTHGLNDILPCEVDYRTHHKGRWG